MKERRYPRLRQTFFERAKLVRNKHLAGLLISGSVSALLVIAHPPNGSKGHFYLAVSGACLLYYLVKSTAILYGLRHFEHQWNMQVEESLKAGASLDAYKAIEEELGDEVVRFKQAIFTRNYLIAFKQMGSFVLVGSILDIEANLRKTYSHGLSLLKPQTYYELSCKVPPNETVILSTDSGEMRQVIEEIFLRNPLVGLSEESIGLLRLE